MVVKHLRITGRVQGVGFRYSMFYAAQNYGITGWVRNCNDGSVEAVAQGETEQVDEFIAWAHKGPSLCEVDGVEISEATGDFETFEIKPTI